MNRHAHDPLVDAAAITYGPGRHAVGCRCLLNSSRLGERGGDVRLRARTRAVLAAGNHTLSRKSSHSTDTTDYTTATQTIPGEPGHHDTFVEHRSDQKRALGARSCGAPLLLDDRKSLRVRVGHVHVQPDMSGQSQAADAVAPTDTRMDYTVGPRRRPRSGRARDPSACAKSAHGTPWAVREMGHRCSWTVGGTLVAGIYAQGACSRPIPSHRRCSSYSTAHDETTPRPRRRPP